LTDDAAPPTIAAMRRFARATLIILLAFPAGCGLFYQAASGYRANKMENNLKVGMTSLQVHQLYGEPDIRNYVNDKTEVWSYAKHANNTDVVAATLYTSAKEGDKGSFVDLTFNDGKLVTWDEGSHTMPAKQGSGFNAGIGGASQQGSAHY
jgi:outer membrane protein assembly factor BamE (lipoprotein component of BamABCDE complex)